MQLKNMIKLMDCTCKFSWLKEYGCTLEFMGGTVLMYLPFFCYLSCVCVCVYIYIYIFGGGGGRGDLDS